MQGDPQVRGYVILDDSGIVGIVPMSYNDPMPAVEYVRKHTVLKTLVKEDKEDMISFKLRLQEEVEKYRKSKKDKN